MWQQLPSGRVSHRFEPLVAVSALLLIPALVIEADVHSHRWQTVAAALNWTIWGVFLAELAFVFAVAERRRAAARAHWFDILIVVATAPMVGKALAALRLLRLARFLRLLRVGMVAGRALQAERRSTSEATFRVVGLLTLFVVLLAGSVETLVDSKDFPNLWDGIWWAVVTVTTVGYGDYYPRSVDGRIVAMVVMLFGIGFLSVLTAAVSSQFVKSDTSSDRVLEALSRIEAELAELRQQVADVRT